MSTKRRAAPRIVPFSSRILPDTSRTNLDLPSTITLPTEGNRFWNEEDQGTTPANRSDQSLEIKKLDKSEYDKDKKKLSKRFWYIIASLAILAIWILTLTILYILHVHENTTIYIYHNQDQDQGNVPYQPSSPGVPLCTDNSNCTAPTQYCDTKYSHQCSECVSSDQCGDPSLQYCDIFGTRACHECFYDRHCTTSPNLVCDTDNTRTCVECMENKDCASNPVNKVCDRTTNTCSMPCTTSMCASRTDGKTKCCGTKCIEDCPGGYACDILQSQCVLKKPSGPKGSNVLKTTTNYITYCSHCHNVSLEITGSLFKKEDLQPMEYMTGFEYIYHLTNPSLRVSDIENAVLYYQEAPTCSKTDFETSPFIELGLYSSITQNYVDFDNILPLKSDCFFILTQGDFKTSFSCYASNDHDYQVYKYLGGGETAITHTPFYEIYGY